MMVSVMFVSSSAFRTTVVRKLYGSSRIKDGVRIVGHNVLRGIEDVGVRTQRCIGNETVCTL